MNEQLQQQLAGYLEAIAAQAKSGSQFVIEQAPLVRVDIAPDMRRPRIET